MTRIIAPVLFFIAALLAGPVHAQTIEFEIPDGYDLIEGRLSVTFREDVTESKAREVVEKLGLTPVSFQFYPVEVSFRMKSPLSNSQLQVLREKPGVLSIDEKDLHPAAAALPYSYLVLMDPSTTRPEAFRAVQFVGGEQTQVIKKPNDVTLSLDEAKEDIVIEQLERHELVKYVAYLSAE